MTDAMGDGTVGAAPGATPELAPAIKALMTRLPVYGRLYWRLLREGGLSRRQQALALGALAYTVSPVDLVPGIIPIVGQMDDVAVALLGLRALLRGLPPAVAAAHLAAVGLEGRQLDEDLETLRRSALALGRQGLRLGSVAALRGARGLAAVAGRLARRQG